MQPAAEIQAVFGTLIELFIDLPISEKFCHYPRMINPEAAFDFRIDPDLCHEQSSKTSCEIHWTIPKDLPYFDGHFPGRPMLPAIGILDASFVLLQKFLQQPIQLQKVISAKFSAPVTSPMTVHIRLEKKENTTWACTWQEKTNEELKPLAQLMFSLDLSTASAAKE